MRTALILAIFVILTAFGCAAPSHDALVASGQASVIVDGGELLLDVTVWRVAEEDRYSEVTMPDRALDHVDVSPFDPVAPTLEAEIILWDGATERSWVVTSSADSLDEDDLADALRDEVDPALFAALELTPHVEGPAH